MRCNSALDIKAKTWSHAANVLMVHNLLYSPQAFTLNSVPPTKDEIVAGGIGRNFVSRDILEATSLDDALYVRFCSLFLLSEIPDKFSVFTFYIVF